MVLLGHGGSQHKKAPPLANTAKRYAKIRGYAVAAIDAPDHGARVSPEQAGRLGEEARNQIVRAGGMRGEALEAMMKRAEQAQREWKAALDAVQSFDFVGARGPVGYLGLSMGAIIGIQFVAHEPRITAAVFGLAGVSDRTHALALSAQKISIPVRPAMKR